MRPPFKGSSGFTLLEVLMSVMIMAVVAAAVFSVILSTNYSDLHTDRTEQTAMILSAAQEKLKPYVLANTGSNPKSPEADTSALPAAMKKGICGDNKDRDPLSTGEHDITCILPKLVEVTSGKRAGAVISQKSSLTYVVSRVACVSGSAYVCTKVVFKLRYDDNGSDIATLATTTNGN